MQGQDLDDYIAKFEELVRHTQYNINGPQTIDMFTRGLPVTLYETIFQHDNPRMFEQWRTAAPKRQGLWFHMNAWRNLDKFKSTSSQKAGGQQLLRLGSGPVRTVYLLVMATVQGVSQGISHGQLYQSVVVSHVR